MGLLTRGEAESIAGKRGRLWFVTKIGDDVYTGQNHFTITHRDGIDQPDIVDAGFLSGAGTPQAPEIIVEGKGHTASPDPDMQDRSATVRGVRRVVAGSQPPIKVWSR